MKKILILLMLATGLAQAEIYKSINEKGEVVYSDQPAPGAERMRLPKLPTYTAPKFSSAPKKVPEVKLYDSMTILKPEDDGVVRDNQGMVSVRLSLEPPLRTKLGHKIQYYLDGKPHGMPVSSTSMNFSNLDRGRHTLSARVVDTKDQAVMSAEPVTFQLHRMSRESLLRLENQDTDGDGVNDDVDAFPNNPDEAADSDGDGVGDNADASPLDPRVPSRPPAAPILRSPPPTRAPALKY